MARKKIIFVIVEGLSDEEALGVILSRIYDKETVYVNVMRRDITSERGITPVNIITEVYREIKNYISTNPFTKNDFMGIIHIIDMDGAYIPASNVINDASALNPIYSMTEIRTNNKAGIEQRNQQKCANINKLCSIKEMGGIPYRAFYMSSNLDHVLYDKLNSDDEEKERNSFDFAVKYKDNLSGFLAFISESDFSVLNGYRESWDFIKEDLHSLERYTNLGLCFKKEDDH